MNKNWLIIRREYLSRVKKKSFILLTLLVPVIIAGFIALEVFVISGGSKEAKHIAVIDNSGLFKGHVKNGESIFFTFLQNKEVQKFRNQYQKAGYDGLLYIPKINIDNPDGFTYYSAHQLGLNPYLYVTGQINSVIKDERLHEAGIDKATLSKMNVSISLSQPSASGGTASGGDQKSNKYITYASSAIGYVAGFLIYFALFLFGTQVLRGVAEEKTSRISEVMVSSVKPFQLMTGKIIGIGAVGLTQFIIWIILAVIGFSVAGSLLPATMSSAGSAQQMGAVGPASSVAILHQVQDILTMLPVTEIIICFLFYFFGGYLLYAALFAAVGSAVDQEMTESQSLTLPITMPIIISFFIMFSTIQQPNSALSVFCSIFPLSSPLVMLARIPYGVPLWQLLLSVILLIAGFLFTTWVAAKIYRTGILLYGKKVTLKEMFKWVVRK